MVRRRRWGLLIEVPAVLVTIAMMLHVTANAVLRTVINEPVPHTLEIVQYWYMPLVAFLGFIAAQARGQHIAADLLYERLPRLAKRGALTAVLVLSIIPCVGFAWFGLQEALDAMATGRTAGVSTVPAWPVYFLVPIAFASLTLQLGYAAWGAARHGLTDDPGMVNDPDDTQALEDLQNQEGTRA